MATGSLYIDLKDLDVSQATQERLWAHLQFKDYTYYRLKKELQDKNDKRINNGVFLKTEKNSRYLCMSYPVYGG